MNLDEQNIIALLEIESLPEDRKLAILAKMTDLIQKRLMLRMIQGLDESSQEELAGVMDSGDSAAVQKFIQTHFPEFETWVQEETLQLKRELNDFQKTTPV